MKSTVMWALVVLNGLLLVTFLSRVLGTSAAVGETPALAQVGQPGGAAPPRRPGDYILIPGEVTGGSNAVVYMIDSTNRQLGAMAYDDTQQQLNVMPPIELDRIFEAAQQTPPGRGAVEQPPRRRTTR